MLALKVGVNVVTAAVEPAEQIMQKVLEFKYRQRQLFSKLVLGEIVETLVVTRL